MLENSGHMNGFVEKWLTHSFAAGKIPGSSPGEIGSVDCNGNSKFLLASFFAR